MSFVADALGFGGRDNSAGRAAEVQGQFNDKAIAEIRRQFDETQANAAPFLQAGTDAIPRVVEGTTPEGLDSIIGRLVNTNIFGNLVDERTRAVEGQLSAGGLTRSGAALEEIANVPTKLALVLENLLFGRNTNLAGSGQNAVFNLGGLGATAADSIGTLFSGTGAALGSGIIGDQNDRAAQSQQQTKSLGSLISTVAGLFGGGGGGGGLSKAVSGIGFSDPRLKKNVVQIGSTKNLKVFQWDWIDAVKGSIIENSQTVGFMADEVEEKYPHHVGEFGGFKIINYPGLLDELEAA